MKRILALLAMLALITIPAAVKADLSGQSFILSSGSATSCTVISPTATGLLGIWNVNIAAQTVTLTLYNDLACTAGDQVYAGVLGASAVVNFPAAAKWFKRPGLSYTLSAAATNYIYGVYQ